MPSTLPQIYGAQALTDDELDLLFDRSLAPRNAAMLYAAAGEWGLRANDRLLDIGCRDARYALHLVRQYGCVALGIDPVADNLAAARTLIAQEKVEQSLAVEEGVIAALPVADASIDFIWCRDMLNHVPDLAAGFAECRRVLKPGKRMLVYQTFATPRLYAEEAAFLYDALAIVAETMDPGWWETAAAAADLRIIHRDVIASEWREAWEEDGSRITAQQLLRIARLQRDPALYVEQAGATTYQIELANDLWGVYQMLGKLCPTLYVLERPTA